MYQRPTTASEPQSLPGGSTSGNTQYRRSDHTSGDVTEPSAS